LDNKVSVPGGKGLDRSVVNLEAMKGLLRKKEAGKAKSTDAKQKAKKSATFAESVNKGASRKPEATGQYNKCVISFAIRVDKGKDTKAGFDKKIIAGFSFLQNYIDSMLPSFQSTGWTQADLPSRKRQTCQLSRSYCAGTLTSLMKGPLTP
jgi:hypothetical protein